MVIASYDVAYGGENGLNQAITLSADSLMNVRFCEEKKMIQNFFEQISLDTGMIVFGVADTMKALELSALEKLMLYDEIEITRYEVTNPAKDGQKKTLYLTPAQEKDPKHLKDAETGTDLDIVSKEALSDWLLVNYQHFGCKIELISDKTQEGF